MMENPGKPGPKPARRMEIESGNYKPTMPSGLHPYAQRFWRAVVPVLAESGQLTPLDRGALEGLCLSYAVMKQAGEELTQAGGTHKDERGIARKHPAFQVWRDSQATFRAWAAQFGLTPLARKAIPEAARDRDSEQDLQTVLRNIARGM